MRLAAVPVLVVLVLSGCAAPDPADPPGEEDAGPIDLEGRLGLMLVDLDARSVTVLAQQQGLAWLAQNGTHVTWTDVNFAVVLNRASGVRDVGPVTVWARVHDDGTGLQLDGARARTRGLVNGSDVSTAPLPNAPPGAAGWSAASRELDVLGAEIQGERALTCTNDLYLRTSTTERMRGCHLRIAPDGRAGWTSATAVWTRAADGAVRNVTAPGSGDPSSDAFVAHENPVFTDEGLLMLRLRGGDQVARTEVVTEAGEPLVTMDGPHRLALHDASGDGRLILLRAFDR